MKEFLKVFAVTLLLLELFLFFGGWLLFDFSRHFFLASAAAAFVIALVFFAFLSQAQRIEDLEQRIQSLEEACLRQ